jgi:outer membrane protein, heavy metal efflux system
MRDGLQNRPSTTLVLLVVCAVLHFEGAAAAAAPEPTEPTEPTETPGLAVAPIIEREWAGTGVRLEEVLQYARDNAPTIVRTEARVSLGTARLEGAKPLLPENPTVSTGLGSRFNPQGTSFEAQFQVWQPFEIAGERRQRMAAGRAAERARRAEVDEVWWETEVEIRAAFAHAVVAREAAEAQASAVAFAERIMAALELKVSTGDLAPLTLRIAETDVADARQQLLQLELEYRNACVRLATVAGWPSARLIEPVGELPRVTDISRTDLASLVEQHPAVLSAEADIDAAESRLDAADRDAWPHPALGAYVAHEQEPGVAFASNVGLLTLSIPLPVWRRNQEERAVARAEVTVSKADASTLKYEIAQEIGARLNAIRTAANRVATYSEEMLPRFSENLRMLERAFELGEIDLLQVFVAQQRFVTQQRRALEIYAAYVEAVRTFELVAGRPLRPPSGSR